jgi:3-oxoacyl-(acyl-carrier-protein) synthase
MSEPIVAITGMGVISSLASSLDGHWPRLLQGATGIRELGDERLPRTLRYAGRVDDDALPPDTPPEVLKQGRLISPSSRLGLRAVDEAMRGSGLDLSQIEPSRRALYIGASDYSKGDYRDFYAAFREAGTTADRAVDPERVNKATLHTVDPFFLLEGLTNNLVAFVSRRYQLQGPNTTLASQSPCGAQALELAARTLVQDQADVAIVVGTCVWSPFVSLFDLDALGLLSRCREGATASSRATAPPRSSWSRSSGRAPEPPACAGASGASPASATGAPPGASACPWRRRDGRWLPPLTRQGFARRSWRSSRRTGAARARATGSSSRLSRSS